jgi:two-component system, LytTR family, sensor kinase
MQAYCTINSIPFYDGFQSKKNSIITLMALKRKNIYWITQVTGWLLLGAINTFVISSIEGNYLGNTEVWLITSAFGVIFTHLYRAFLKKNKWLDLQLKKLIPRVIFSSFIIGIMLVGIFVIAHSILLDKYTPQYYTPLTAIINLSSSAFLWSLIYFSVHYLENYRKAEIESYIWEAAVKDFELKTLKSQLNPHFMFNALNSIRALIQEDPENAKNAVTKLSNILRYSLKMEKTETVSLEDEIKTVSDYLSLEKIRYEERLKYKLDISENSLNIGIPPMMIQTLAENAIKHGISKMKDGGSICISTSILNSKLYIKIVNTGQIEKDSLKKASGYGINNTRHRLSLLYGEKSSFKIENINSKEVFAEVIIPIGEMKNESTYNR